MGKLVFGQAGWDFRPSTSCGKSSFRPIRAFFVMPGLDPGIHVRQHKSLVPIVILLRRVDGRVKHGHDGIG